MRRLLDALTCLALLSLSALAVAIALVFVQILLEGR